MAGLLIESPLAERLRALAEQEQRSVESLLEEMVEQYNSSLSLKEIYNRLRKLGDAGITLPEDDTFIEDEAPAPAQMESISGAQMVIEERKQGW